MKFLQKLFRRQEFEPYNVKRIVGDLEKVYQTKDIYRLEYPTYEFLNKHMIRDYTMNLWTKNMPQFQKQHEDVRLLCRSLIGGWHNYGGSWSYISQIENRLFVAQQYENQQSIRWRFACLRHNGIEGIYAYYASAAQAIRKIVKITRLHQNRVIYHYEQQKKRDVGNAVSKLSNYGINLMSEDIYEPGIYKKGPLPKTLSKPMLPPYGAQCRIVPTW